MSDLVPHPIEEAERDGATVSYRLVHGEDCPCPKGRCFCGSVLHHTGPLAFHEEEICRWWKEEPQATFAGSFELSDYLTEEET